MTELEAIRRIVGEAHVLRGEDAAPYAVAGVAPDAVAAPATREEAAALLLAVREAGGAVVPRGGGTWIDFGFPPRLERNGARRLFLVMDMRRLDRLVDYQPDDMTVTVEVGMPLARLAEILSRRGQFLPLDPPCPQRATAGGTVAAAATGAWRAGYGSPRDWLIGCRVLQADGREIRGGGQVVKNVAGYDLPKLYTGSFGTLGLLTELTFKVLPRPPAAGYASVRLPSPEATEALLASAMDSDLQPAALELRHPPTAPAPDGFPWELLFQFLHVPEAIAWQQERLAELTAAAGGRFETLGAEEGERRIRAAIDRLAEPAAGLLARIGALSGQVATIAARAVEALRLETGARPEIAAHAATGQVWVFAGDARPGRAAAALRDLARAFDAVCVFPRVPPGPDGAPDPWGPVGPEFRLMQGIKAALDPDGLFAPGRFVGGL